MAMWSRRVHAPAAPLPTVAQYLEDAAVTKARVRAAREVDHTKDKKKAESLENARERAILDEERVAARVAALRDAREKNHFTDRIRALLQAGQGHTT